MASLTKRGGIWYGRHIYRRADGKRGDKRVSFETSDRAVAMRRLRRWETELEAEKWGEDPHTSFDEAAQRFLNEHCRGLADASVERYRTSIRQLKRHLGGKLLNDIGKAELLAFELARRKDPGRYSADGKPKGKKTRVTTASIRRDLACLSSIYGFAVTKEWVQVNPVPAFLKTRKKSGGLREGQPRTRYLSHNEEARLIAALTMGDRLKTWNGRMLYAAVVFAIDTGLRLEEQLSTEWQNVQLSGEPHIFVPRGSNDTDRKVPLFDRVANVVAGLPIHRRAMWVFHRKGTGDRYLDFKKGLAAACRRARIADLTWHDLRRTCGCRLLQDHGASMLEVSKWLGHSNMAVTEKHYAFLRQDQLGSIVERARAKQEERPSAAIVQLRRHTR